MSRQARINTKLRQNPTNDAASYSELLEGKHEGLPLPRQWRWLKQSDNELYFNRYLHSLLCYSPVCKTVIGFVRMCAAGALYIKRNICCDSLTCAFTNKVISTRSQNKKVLLWSVSFLAWHWVIITLSCRFCSPNHYQMFPITLEKKWPQSPSPKRPKFAPLVV